MNRGQYSSVFKLLQGAVFAMAFLAILWGVVQWITYITHGTDVQTISSDVLKSAYNARGTGHSFVKTAWLKNQDFSSDSLIIKSGIPPSTNVKIFCDAAFCEFPGCALPGNGCTFISLTKGYEVKVCSSCDDLGECRVYIDKEECSPANW
ncbi:hypothetical protein K8R43_04030 [archaeon]|nr:hypothetical protein [archaeon]